MTIKNLRNYVAGLGILIALGIGSGLTWCLTKAYYQSKLEAQENLYKEKENSYRKEINSLNEKIALQDEHMRELQDIKEKGYLEKLTVYKDSIKTLKEEKSALVRKIQKTEKEMTKKMNLTREEAIEKFVKGEIDAATFNKIMEKYGKLSIREKIRMAIEDYNEYEKLKEEVMGK